MTASLQELDTARIAREEQREAWQSARDRARSLKLGMFAAGRVLLGAVFLGSAVGMIADYSGTIASLQETVVDVHRWVPAAIAFQALAGVAIGVGLRARLAAVLTGTYLLATLLLVPPDLQSELGRAVGFANLGLLSALAMLAAHGAGRLSVDHPLERRRRRAKSAARAATPGSRRSAG